MCDPSLHKPLTPNSIIVQNSKDILEDKINYSDENDSIIGRSYNVYKGDELRW